MTGAMREQVAELLRCAADDARPGAFTRAAADLGVHNFDPIARNAGGAFGAARFVSFEREGYRERLLEAAQLVEEGTWP